MEKVFHSEPGIDPASLTSPADAPETEKTVAPEGSEEGTPTPEGKDTSGLEKKAETATEEEAEAALEIAGLDMSELSKEYAKDGKLSDESYEELAEAGFPKHVVDAYIRGITQGQAEAAALAEKDIAEVLSVAGGEEGYGKLMEWATKAFSAEEKEAYNRAVNIGDKHIAKLAVQGLVARYEAEFGKEPVLVNGGGKAVEDTNEGFKSRADMVAAMSDKRYGRDPDYTREVEKKVVNSKLMSSRRS